MSGTRGADQKVSNADSKTTQASATTALIPITPAVTQAIQVNTTAVMIRTLRSPEGAEVVVERLPHGGHSIEFKPPTEGQERLQWRYELQIPSWDNYSVSSSQRKKEMVPFDKTTNVNFLLRGYTLRTRALVKEMGISNVPLSPKPM